MNLTELLDAILNEYLVPRNPIGLVIGVISLFYFLPIYRALRYWQLTGSKDYLIYAIFLLSITLSPILDPAFYALIEWNPQIFTYVWNVGFGRVIRISLFLFLIRVKWQYPPKILYYGGLSYLLASIALDTVFSFLLWEFYYNVATIYWQIMDMLFLVIVHLFGVYVFLTLEEVVPDYQPFKIGKTLFIISHGLTAIGVILTLKIVFDLAIGGTVIFYVPEVLAVVPSQVSDLIVTPLLNLFFYLYPELILLSEAQVLHAVNLYRYLGTTTEPEVPLPRAEQVQSYIQAIPPEFLPKNTLD